MVGISNDSVNNKKKVVLVTGGTGLVGKGIESFIETGAYSHHLLV